MDQIHLVIFRLEKQAYAFSIDSISQMIDMVTIMPLPKSDPMIEGVINVHGRLIPVIDLHRLFLGGSHSLNLHTPILLVTIENKTIGLIVDELLDVYSLMPDQIAETTDILPNGSQAAPILRGVTMVANEMVMLLDLDCVLDSGQRRALHQIVASVQEHFSQATLVGEDPHS